MKRTITSVTFLLAAASVPFTAASQAGAAAAQAGQITQADLIGANPAEWLAHGRDLGETYYSPLDQIDLDSVDRLGLAWSYDLQGFPGRLEATPIVHDGVIYATGTWSLVFAVDARTGEEIWRWDPGVVQGGRSAGGASICCGPVNRGVAVYEGKVFVGILDGRLAALDADTGHLLWVRQTTPLDSEYAITMAPRVVNGNVIIGNGGAEYGVRGYVTAYDTDTGEQVWRTYTVPGNPAEGFESDAMEFAATTWEGTWWELGGGGTVWDGMAFDPEADLLYVGTGNGSPWSRAYRSNGTGDNLYLSSILALDPDTGEIVWYYQTTPGDDWDYTATQNIILADIEIGGELRQVLMQAPKNGFFYVLDRLTGELLSAEAYSHVTWAYEVDMETGRPIETPEARYTTDGSWLAPGPIGAHNWQPMSWSPDTGLVYIPGQYNQSLYRENPDFEVRPGAFNTGTGGAGGAAGDPPEIPQPAGFITAWDPVTQRERWRVEIDGSRNGGTLATGGGLLFSAGLGGEFFALDGETGEVVWEVQLPSGPASPVTYELDGRQYVSILSGPGGAQGPARLWTFALDASEPIPQS